MTAYLKPLGFISSRNATAIKRDLSNTDIFSLPSMVFTTIVYVNLKKKKDFCMYSRTTHIILRAWY